eukprot:Seg2147.6 transcript_id=Seg2147.6/GoldUCD/mRNA.D3Y31 product="Circumsporozoite protein" protein_id=Seg2147.6/GoldUCD/D3Y31
MEQSKQLYHKLVLEGYLLMACMIRVEFGSVKAEKIINKWISGYDSPTFKQIIEDNLKSVLDIADTAVSIKQCRHWVVMATRYNEFQVPAITTVQSIVEYLTDKLAIGGGSLAKIGPATGSMIMRCLQTTSGLNKVEKERIASLVGAGQDFTYQLVGAAMSRVLGHHSSADLLRVLAHELNRASYLDRDEVKKRVKFLVSGFKLSAICKKLKSDQDCLEAVEADFSTHTPHGDPLILPPQLHSPHAVQAHAPLTHPALAHLPNPSLMHSEHKPSRFAPHHVKPLLEHIGLGSLLDKKPTNTKPTKQAKPAKPTPSEAGKQPLTHKQGKDPTSLKLGAPHPGVSVVGKPHPIDEAPVLGDLHLEQPHEAPVLGEQHLNHPHLENSHPINAALNLGEEHLDHHITEDWPLDVHPEHLTSSAEELVGKLEEMDNPLVSAIMANKNPELVKVLQDSGNPELLQSLLKAPAPQRPLNTREKARQRLRELLAAFKGDKHKLIHAIKAHARLRLLNYLQTHKTSKLLEMMKMNKEPLLAGQGPHNHLGIEVAHIHHTPHPVVNFKLRPHTNSETALELLKLLQIKHGMHKPKIHPNEMKPGKEILDELKAELGTLGFKHKTKPDDYVDNTLVHFGDLAFNGLGLPIDPQTGQAFNNPKHTNPFQYEEDWKGALMHNRRHHRHHYRVPEWQRSQERPYHQSFSQMHQTLHHKPLEDGFRQGQMLTGEGRTHASQNGRPFTSLDDTSATFGGFPENNPNKENLKNVFKDMASNNMDSHDVENLISNLPGIVGHHVGQGEVGNILSQFGKPTGQPIGNPVTLPERPVNNEQLVTNAQQMTGVQQQAIGEPIPSENLVNGQPALNGAQLGDDRQLGEAEQLGQPVGDVSPGQPVEETAPGQPVAEAAPGQPVAEANPGQAVSEGSQEQPVSEAVTGQPISEATTGQPVSEAATGQPVSEGAPGQPVSEPTPGQPVTEATPEQLPAQATAQKPDTGAPSGQLVQEAAPEATPDIAPQQKHEQPNKIVELMSQQQGVQQQFFGGHGSNDAGQSEQMIEGNPLLQGGAAEPPGLQTQMKEGGVGLPVSDTDIAAQLNAGAGGAMLNNFAGGAGEKMGETEGETHIGPSQKEIHVYNNQPMNSKQNGDEGKVIDVNTAPFASQEQDADNYAGITESDNKPKEDLLNLNGKIQGIEGLEDTKSLQGMNFDDAKDAGSFNDEDKSVQNLLSTDAKPPIQADSETLNEIKEQEEFDANALKTEPHNQPIRPNTINTNFLESFDDTKSERHPVPQNSINTNLLESFDDDGGHNTLKKVSVSQGNKEHDIVDDYMDYIHKEDNLDESYSKNYYKNDPNPLTMATGSMFGDNDEFAQFEKKTLKGKSILKGKGSSKKLQHARVANLNKSKEGPRLMPTKILKITPQKGLEATQIQKPGVKFNKGQNVKNPKNLGLKIPSKANMNVGQHLTTINGKQQQKQRDKNALALQSKEISKQGKATQRLVKAEQKQAGKSSSSQKVAGLRKIKETSVKPRVNPEKTEQRLVSAGQRPAGKTGSFQKIAGLRKIKETSVKPKVNPKKTEQRLVRAGQRPAGKSGSLRKVQGLRTIKETAIKPKVNPRKIQKPTLKNQKQKLVKTNIKTIKEIPSSKRNNNKKASAKLKPFKKPTVAVSNKAYSSNFMRIL